MVSRTSSTCRRTAAGFPVFWVSIPGMSSRPGAVQGATAVISRFDREVGESNEQGELVRCRELTLVEKGLEALEKPDLLVGGRRRESHRFAQYTALSGRI